MCICDTAVPVMGTMQPYCCTLLYNSNQGLELVLQSPKIEAQWKRLKSDSEKSGSELLSVWSWKDFATIGKMNWEGKKGLWRQSHNETTKRQINSHTHSRTHTVWAADTLASMSLIEADRAWASALAGGQLFWGNYRDEWHIACQLFF